MKYVKSSKHFSKNELACKCKKTDCEAKGMNSDLSGQAVNYSRHTIKGL